MRSGGKGEVKKSSDDMARMTYKCTEHTLRLFNLVAGYALALPKSSPFLKIRLLEIARLHCSVFLLELTTYFRGKRSYYQCSFGVEYFV